MQLIDIGGSGVKSIQLPLCGNPNLSNTTNLIHHKAPDWGNFVPWLAQNGLLEHQHIGISCRAIHIGKVHIKRMHLTPIFICSMMQRRI